MKLLNRQSGTSNADLRLAAVVLLGLLFLSAATIASLTVGARPLSLETVSRSLSGQDAGADGAIVIFSRLPRTLAGLAAGVALGVSGALIQTICRNPLSDPGVLGINAGAGLAVALAVLLLGPLAPALQFLTGISGALLVVLLVFAIGGAGGGRSDPGQFILAGIALAAVMGGLTTALSLLNPSLFDRLRYWSAGTLDIRDLQLVMAVLPVLGAGAVTALVLARPLNALALGSDMAASLGVRPVLVQGGGLALVAVLCGTATALTGPIGFVGLMAPHVARRLLGPDLRRVLPFCMIFAPVLLLAADIVGRIAVAGELRVSIVTAFLGAPMLIWIARRMGHGGR